MRYVGLGRDKLRSHFVFRPRHAPEWLRAWFLPVVFLTNEEELTGKTFTTSLTTTNPNTYVKFIFLRTSPLRPSKFTCIFCQSRITPLCFSLFFFSLCFIPTVISHCVFFHSFFLVFPTHPRTLSPPSALPHPLPSLFIQGLVSVVLCICLKIGLGCETFSSENNKSVRLIL